ncbi:hypothetical protein [Rhizorhabdus sp. FW153]|uniref:hypothetical protein n=1 Tax=Rhizorhabdus sp. FW153 TaxID=3400216 RepID=UPI003CEEA356
MDGARPVSFETGRSDHPPGDATDAPRARPPGGAAQNAGCTVHGSELPLVWDKVRDPQSAFLGPEGPAAEALARRMHAHWISFIRSGKPGADWPLHRPDAPQTMVFDAKDRPVTRLDEGERSLWDGARFDVG